MSALSRPRHEKFVRAYLKTGIGSKAYCKAYDRLLPDATARVNASRLLTHANINIRLCELREQAMKRSDITIDKIITDCQNALNMAASLEKPADMVNAAMAQAKIVGLLKDKIEHGNAGDFDTMENMSDIIQSVSDQAGPEAALALSKAFGLDKQIADIDQIAPASDTVN
jgi:hypothetical protein